MLRSILKFFPRLLVLAAWSVVVVAGVLVALEESGVLTDLVRAKLADRLGPVGEGLEIEHVRLRWFEPGIIAEGVSLRALPAADDGTGGEIPIPFLRLDSIHLSIHEEFDPARPLRRLRIDGGHVRVSDDLFDSLDRFSAWQREVAGEDAAGPNLLRLQPPSMILTDFEVSLELPDGETVDLGRVALAAEPDDDRGYRVLGRLTPSLHGIVSQPVAIHIEGHQDRDGARLRTTVQGLRLEATGATLPAYLGALPVERFSGALTATMDTRLTWSPGSALHSELRTSITDAQLLLRGQEMPVEDLGIELHSVFDYAPGRRLWDREAWSARARIDGEWGGSPLLAYGQFGKDAPGRDWARIWGRFEELHLESSTLEGLRLGGATRRTWDALEPVGVVDGAFNLTLPPSRGPRRAPQWNPEMLVHVRLVGRSGMTYRGWPDHLGEPEGFPLVCSELRGDLLLSVVEDATRPMRLGLVGVSGQHGSGTILGDGLLTSPDPASGFPFAELDLRLRIPSIAIDDTLRAGLDGSPSTREIWPEYQPVGGTIAGTGRLVQSAEAGGFTAFAEVDVFDTTMRWSGLPIALSGMSGHLTLAWDALALRARDIPGREHYRPFGLAYRFSNVSEYGTRDRAEAEVIGFTRERSYAPAELDAGEMKAADISENWTQDITVRIPDLLLRGADWEILAETFPEVAQQVNELGAKGSVAARYRGGRTSPTAPYVSEVEVSPTRVEITPQRFRRRTLDLRGRILVGIIEKDDVAEEETHVRFALSGGWSQGVELAMRGEIPPRGTARLDVFGAGVDPTNTAFKGALAAVLAEGAQPLVGERMDSTGGSLRGLLDFASRTEFEAEEEGAEEVGTLRVQLRGNELENGSLHLTGLRGVLEQAGNQWRSSLLEATLAGHPLELRNVLLVRLGDAAMLPEADPLLGRSGFWSDPDGFALQAELHVDDLPVDEEHLSSLLDEEILLVLRESTTWTGAIDVHGAQILLTSEAEGEGKVAIRGAVEPHDLSMRLGLPIQVTRGILHIRELIFEQGIVRGWGEIEDLDALIADRRLSNARMIVGYVDGRLTIDNLRGDFEGGGLESLGGAGSGSRKAVGIDLSPPYRFDVAVRVRDVPLDRLLRGVFPSPIADQGILNAGLHVSGTPGEVLGMSGSGWVRLEEGRLWSIPVMRDLFHQIGFDQTAVFDRLRARFRLRDGVIETPDLEIKSRIVNLVGDGATGFDGTLHYDLELHYSLLDRIEGPNLLLYWVNNLLWRVAVRGDMARPVVRVRNAVLEILRPFKSPPRSLPLPGFAPLPRRF